MKRTVPAIPKELNQTAKKALNAYLKKLKKCDIQMEQDEYKVTVSFIASNERSRGQMILYLTE